MDMKRGLRIWSQLVSPSIPIAFMMFLGVVCVVKGVTRPQEPVWLILTIVCFVVSAGGIAVLLVRRHLAIKRTGRWL